METQATSPSLPLIVLALLPDDALSLVEAARAVAATLLPALQAPDYAPHLTLLNFGEVLSTRIPAVREAVARVVADQEAIRLQAGQLSWLSTTTEDTTRTFVIIEYRRRALSELNMRLLRACAVDIASEQPDEYRPHITLGYLPRALTDDERTALEDLRSSGRWTLSRLELRSRTQRIGEPFDLLEPTPPPPEPR